MQVANTFNNTIRILFNPKLEAFKLFDFLMVKSDNCKYIAQIIEIYDDKFDASQNVAKLKLFYQVNQNSEVIPYDNFTPNKECEIVKVRQEEIETFINQDKETFIFGTNVKSQCALNLQYDFFNNNAIVLADKVENANAITYNLAKNLSSKRNVVIIDQTGILDYEDAKKIKAGKNFRMSLNYSTIDHVFNKCLADASLEFQAIGGEIINEIKRFAKKQENEFIPFNQLTKVLMQQYKATPYPELKLLLVRLKKYQMDEVFAKTKNDKENLFKTIEKNPITILDLSSIDAFWQKAYIDYIISDVTQEIYLLARINDEHFDSDLISKIYNKKKNIKFVPNVSYNYKRLPSVVQYCKNYILMPSLFQRTDFLNANFALSNLISQDCVLFGENTDNFLYLACDYELEVQEKRKNYRKIALTLALQEQENNTNSNEEKQNNDNPSNIIKELNEFNTSQKASLQHVDEYIETNAPDEDFDEIENPTEEHAIEKIVQKQEDDLIFTDTINQSEEIQEEKGNDEFQELDNSIKTQENVKNDETSSLIFKDEYEKNEKNENVEVKDVSLNSDENNEETMENAEEEIEETSALDDDLLDISDEELDFFQMAQEANDEYEEIEEKVIETPETEEENNNVEIQEETGDFKEVLIKEETDSEDNSVSEIDENSQDDMDDETQEEESEGEEQEIVCENEAENDEESLNISQEDINLAEIADNSIDENFEEIINKKNNQSANTISIDENVKLDESAIAQRTAKENLPIFKEEENEDDEAEIFEIGDIIIHKKYGRGSVVKTIKYEDRQLLQIEFEQAGKKLLDPKVAEIELEQ